MSNKTLIIGAGGHARIVASVAGDTDLDILGVIDKDNNSIGEKVGDYEIVDTIDNLNSWLKKGVRKILIAIGNNQERKELFFNLKTSKIEFPTLIHKTAVINRSCKIGEGSLICPGVIIGAEVNIGISTIINSGSIVEHESEIGDFSSIAPGCNLAGRVKIGKKSFIGIGATISNNLSIGENCVVGAGSVVIKNVSSESTVYGVPAKEQLKNI